MWALHALRPEASADFRSQKFSICAAVAAAAGALYYGGQAMFYLDILDLHKRGTYAQGYLGFAKMYLEVLELLLELLLQLLLELLLLQLLSWQPRAW